MLSLIIYLVVGLATGWQVLQVIIWAIWGAPTSPIEYVGLVGSWGMDLAGILAFRRKKVSLVMAAAGLIGSWSFYVPALVQTLHRTQNVVWEPLVFVAPVLLALATVYFALDLGMYVRKTKAFKPPA